MKTAVLAVGLGLAVTTACSSSDGTTDATSSAALACTSASDHDALAHTYGADNQTVQRAAAGCLMTTINGDAGVLAGGPSADGGRAPDGGAPPAGAVEIDDAFVSRVAGCVREVTADKLSSGCATCYAAFEGCVVSTCSGCQGDPMGKTCVACRCGRNDRSRNCVGEFEACAGTKLDVDCTGALADGG